MDENPFKSPPPFDKSQLEPLFPWRLMLESAVAFSVVMAIREAIRHFNIPSNCALAIYVGAWAVAWPILIYLKKRRKAKARA
jgi:hypothetical protein